MYSDWWKIEWVKEMFFLLLYYDIDQNWILALQQFKDTHNKLILPKMISDYFMEATIHKINDHSCRSEEKFDLPFGTELVDLMSRFNGLWNRDFWWICLNNCFFNFNNNSENSFDVHPQKMSHSIMNIHLFKEVILSSINWTSKSPYTKQKLPQCIKIYPAIFPNIFVPSYHNLSTEHDSISANFTPLPTTSPLLDFFFFFRAWNWKVRWSIALSRTRSCSSDLRFLTDLTVWPGTGCSFRTFHCMTQPEMLFLWGSRPELR